MDIPYLALIALMFALAIGLGYGCAALHRSRS